MGTGGDNKTEEECVRTTLYKYLLSHTWFVSHEIPHKPC